MAVPSRPEHWSSGTFSGCDYSSAPVAPTSGSPLYGRDLSLIYNRCCVLDYGGSTLVNPAPSRPSYRRFPNGSNVLASRAQYLSDYLSWVGNYVAGTTLDVSGGSGGGGEESDGDGDASFRILGAFSTYDEADYEDDDDPWWESYYSAQARAKAVVEGLLSPAGPWSAAPTFASGDPELAASIASMFSRCSQLKWVRKLGSGDLASDAYFYIAAWANSPPYDDATGTFTGGPTYEFRGGGPNLRNIPDTMGTGYMDCVTETLYRNEQYDGFANIYKSELSSGYCPQACPDAASVVFADAIEVRKEWTEYTDADHFKSHRVQTWCPVVTTPIRVTRAAGESTSGSVYVFSPAQRVKLVKALARIAGGPPVISAEGEPSQYYANSWVWTSGITGMNFYVGHGSAGVCQYKHPEYCEP